MICVHDGAMGAGERREILAGKTIGISEGAAAHAIEQHVCEMVNAGGLVGGLLQAIGGGDTVAQSVAVGREALAQGTFENGRLLEFIL